jgi:phage-related protein
MGSSYRDLIAFPDEAKHQAGFELWLVQRGSQPSDWKPMTSVGTGVYEIRVRSRQEHRIFYVAKHAEAVYVLRAFEKRARQLIATYAPAAARSPKWSRCVGRKVDYEDQENPRHGRAWKRV